MVRFNGGFASTSANRLFDLALEVLPSLGRVLLNPLSLLLLSLLLGLYAVAALLALDDRVGDEASRRAKRSTLDRTHDGIAPERNP